MCLSNEATAPLSEGQTKKLAKSGKYESPVQTASIFPRLMVETPGRSRPLSRPVFPSEGGHDQGNGRAEPARKGAALVPLHTQVDP